MSCFAASASHIAGGEMYYKYIGPGSTTGTDKYQITLRLFRECNPASQGAGSPGIAELPDNVTIGIFNTATGVLIQAANNILQVSKDVISLKQVSPCIVNPPNVCYQVASYVYTIDLAKTTGGYTIAYQTCCRASTVVNIEQFQLPGQSYSGEGATYMCQIPGTDILGASGTNTSPVFKLNDTALVCQNKKFVLNFGATEADGDSLSYTFCSAFNRGASTGASNIVPSSPSSVSPYYKPVTYLEDFSGTSPLGSQVTIDPVTGVISGIAPNSGSYVVNVCVNEWRDNKVINTHRKDFILKVASCDFAQALLPAQEIVCDSLSVNFENETNSSSITSYYWDFGVPTVRNDTSLEARPTYTYADTGVYNVTLYVNRNQTCSDSATMVLKLFPGFKPGFVAEDGCKGLPIQFRDTTISRYGVVNQWHWNFGDPAVLSDTSLLKTPSYTYPDVQDYNVVMTVTDSKGCTADVNKTITIYDKPPLKVSSDTIMCYLDTIQLGATGSGTFLWSPNSFINNVSIDSPLVHPSQSTMYYVQLTFGPGCINTDSVFVDVRHDVTLDMGSDTLICLTDSVQLNIVSNGLSYAWTPTATLSDSSLANPYATPTSTTTYHVKASIGSCYNLGQITVATAPYSELTASADVTICFDDTTQLQVQGNATRYLWSPASSLNNASSSTPLAFPYETTSFIVAGYTDNGCPKPAFDTVVVTVIPQVMAYAGHDTTIVQRQPLQLTATGGQVYLWFPATGLDNTTISDPVAILYDSITYVVKVSTLEGCFAFDTIHVTVYKTIPDIFVPNGFTPNNDGHNDVLKAIPVGLKEFQYLRVYNRWGQLVFSTSDPNRGWDGSLSGEQAAQGTYVWMVRGVDYLGKVIQKKGTVILVR